MFSSTVMNHWLPAAAGDLTEGEGVVVIDPALPENRSVSVLEVEDGPTVVRLSPDRAAHLGHAHGERIAADEATERITAAGIALNNPDHLFYLPVEEHASVLAETADDTLAASPRRTSTRSQLSPPRRPRTTSTKRSSNSTTGSCSARSSRGDWPLRRACSPGGARGSPTWASSRFPSTGVAVSPGDGAGDGAEALEQGYEPQYRCQLDNAPSVALALASGFRRFGEWTVIDD